MECHHRTSGAEHAQTIRFITTLCRLLLVGLLFYGTGALLADPPTVPPSDTTSPSSKPEIAGDGQAVGDSQAVGDGQAVGDSQAVVDGQAESEALLSNPAESDLGSPPGLSFGVFPFLATSHLSDGFAPLIAQLQVRIRQKILFRSTRDYQTFMELLDQEAFDLAYVQPFDYVRIAEPRGYRCLAHRPGELFARIVVNHRSATRNLEDLRGKVLGLPPEVAAISYVSRAMIRKLGLDSGDSPIEARHFRTHDSCLQQLLVGNIDACSVGDSAARGFENRMGLKLKTIAETPSIPPSLIVGHPRLGDDQLKRIQRILHQMKQAPATRAILGLDVASTLVPASDDEYESVRFLWKALEKSPGS